MEFINTHKRDIGLVLGGIAAGWIAGRQHLIWAAMKSQEERDALEAEYEALADEEKGNDVASEPFTIKEMAEKLHEPTDDEDADGDLTAIRGPVPYEVAPAPEQVRAAVRESVFGTDNTWDWESENLIRQEARIYMITDEEFVENENDYDQVTLTFYEGDDIMSDPSDVPVYQYGQVVGAFAFGHGTNDKNVCYVRNDDHKIEYEILRHTGHYAVEVLGLEMQEEADEAELRHGHGLRRMRDWD